jgi:hypothetical protein
MSRLSRFAAPEGRRLLCVLLVWIGEVSAYSAVAKLLWCGCLKKGVRAERVPGRDVCPPRILQKSLFSGTLQHRTGWLTTLVK